MVTFLGSHPDVLKIVVGTASNFEHRKDVPLAGGVSLYGGNHSLKQLHTAGYSCVNWCDPVTMCLRGLQQSPWPLEL